MSQTSNTNWFAARFLEWGPGSDKPPTYKQLSDNLRAYLTIGAYVVVLYYLWNFGPYRIPAWVYQSTAILWGIWLLWFTMLTVAHTFYLYLGFIGELFVFLSKPWITQKFKDGGPTESQRVIATFFFVPFACAGLALVSGVFYLGLAWLRINKMI